MNPKVAKHLAHPENRLRYYLINTRNSYFFDLHQRTIYELIDEAQTYDFTEHF